MALFSKVAGMNEYSNGLCMSSSSHSDGRMGTIQKADLRSVVKAPFPRRDTALSIVE